MWGQTIEDSNHFVLISQHMIVLLGLFGISRITSSFTYLPAKHPNCSKIICSNQNSDGKNNLHRLKETRFQIQHVN